MKINLVCLPDIHNNPRPFYLHLEFVISNYLEIESRLCSVDRQCMCAYRQSTAEVHYYQYSRYRTLVAPTKPNETK